MAENETMKVVKSYERTVALVAAFSGIVALVFVVGYFVTDNPRKIDAYGLVAGWCGSVALVWHFSRNAIWKLQQEIQRLESGDPSKLNDANSNLGE